jgi:GNAT superfamily N-acetyltransferase
MADHSALAHPVSVAPEPFDAPDSRELRREVEGELLRRYGADAEEGVKPHRWDVAAFLVARDAEGRAVGCGALRPLAGGVAEIKRMYVRPLARGAGLSRTLLAALEDEARSRGFTMIRLETGTKQPEAMGLYAAAGYREIEGFGAYADHPESRCFERALVP